MISETALEISNIINNELQFKNMDITLGKIPLNMCDTDESETVSVISKCHC